VLRDKAVRGLSLQQPWASLVVLGSKRIETRSWHTPYRGWLAIHSSAEFPPWAREFLRAEPFKRELERIRGDLPLGQILAVVKLATCFEITESFVHSMERLEYTFGDYTPGRYAFSLTDLHPLARPIPYKGRLGTWSIPPETEIRIRTAAGLQ
jgi:activating signal cointegrator 1